VTATAPVGSNLALAILERQMCGRAGCRCFVSTRRGRGLTHCVVHSDPGPSMNVTPVKAGLPLVHCQVQCSQDAVLDALRERGLWPERAEYRNGIRNGIVKSTVSTWYDYRDEQGALLFQVGRKVPKGFVQRRPDRNGGWIWKLDDTRRVLYRLPEVLAADPSQTVDVVEGEKDVDRLWALGFVATCNPHGAGKWRAEYAEALRGRHVVVLADNDEPGRDHAAVVARSLGNVAASVHVLELPGLPEHGDVSDWLDAGHDSAALSAAANFTSHYIDPTLEVKFACDAADLLAEDGDDALPYLPLLGRDGYIVEGWSHLLAGYPRVGKTELLVHMVREWLDLGHRVVWFTEEPRTMWKVRIKRRGSWPRGLPLIFGLGIDPKELLDMMATTPEEIVLVDTVRNLLRLKDETDNSEIARVLNPWIATARQVAKTPMLVHHDRKGGGEHGEGIAGGHALLGAVDIALELLRDNHGVANRRRIRAFPRVIQPPELLYERDHDGTMRALGEPDAVALEEVKRRALDELTDDWQKTDEVYTALEEPRPSKEQLRKALLLLAECRQASRDPDVSVAKAQGKTVRWRLATSLPTRSPLVGSEVAVTPSEEELPW